MCNQNGLINIFHCRQLILCPEQWGKYKKKTQTNQKNQKTKQNKTKPKKKKYFILYLVLVWNLLLLHVQFSERITTKYRHGQSTCPQCGSCTPALRLLTAALILPRSSAPHWLISLLFVVVVVCCHQTSGCCSRLPYGVLSSCLVAFLLLLPCC